MRAAPRRSRCAVEPRQHGRMGHPSPATPDRLARVEDWRQPGRTPPMNLCIHDLPADQCALCTGAAGAEHDTGQRKNMAPYDEPDEHGNTRWYQVWWDSFPTSVGPAEIELVSEPPP